MIKFRRVGSVVGDSSYCRHGLKNWGIQPGVWCEMLCEQFSYSSDIISNSEISGKKKKSQDFGLCFRQVTSTIAVLGKRVLYFFSNLFTQHYLCDVISTLHVLHCHILWRTRIFHGKVSFLVQHSIKMSAPI